MNSIFAGVTILIMSAFMLAGGRGWIDAALRSQSPERRQRVDETLDRITYTVGAYIAGALGQAVDRGPDRVPGADDPRRPVRGARSG